MTQSGYIGRFAPSPTGPLHFGSLVTAVASFLDARAQQGTWLVRMEDIDPLREQPGAADDILASLEHYHLHWDGSVLYQSRRSEAYEALIQQLLKQQLAFYCTCSRKDIMFQNQAQGQQGSLRYPGTCRFRQHPPNTPYAIRLRVTDKELEFTDRLQGRVIRNLARDSGDFVIKRKEGWYAYHLAVTLDDAAQGITHVVRGCDLLDSTPSHCYLQDCLDFTRPEYCHLPVVINAQGQKLSKQNKARPLPRTNPAPLLWQSLQQLGQKPPKELVNEPATIILQWGIQHWRWQDIPSANTFSPEGV